MNMPSLTEIYYILRRINPELAGEEEKRLRLYGLRIVPIEGDASWREAAKIKCEYALSLADVFAVTTSKALKSKLVAGSDEEGIKHSTFKNKITTSVNHMPNFYGLTHDKY